MRLKFSGIRALILGGSSDIAISLAKSMIKCDLYPILTYRSEKSQNRILNKLKAYVGNYETAYFDFSEIFSIDTLFAQINNDLDFLVDFAQGDMEGLIASVNDNDIKQYFKENVSFRVQVIKKAARIMLKKKKGRLIFISSSAAKRPNLGQGFYSAAKLASEAFYKNLGLELGSKGITTVTLRPGYINSGRCKNYIQKYEKEILKMVPIKEFLTEKQLTETILFFLSNSASYFNATEISIDGGLTAGK
ncbi:SDR family oxidoreductase [Candidatus Magnetomoraceae bacterium gMMP-15]